VPGIPHEAPLELLRRNPQLATALLAGAGLAVPADSVAVVASTDMTSALPSELRADAVIALEGPAAKLVVVVEVQTAADIDKKWVWPSYLVQARLQHRCPAVLLVICRDRATGRWARQRISCGHPNFDLVPLVIDADTTPAPDISGASAAPAELAVLGAFTGAINLEEESGLRTVLGAIAAAGLERDQLGTYTQLIRASASVAARKALEAMMGTVFKDDFLERFFAEGEAKGLAEGQQSMLLRILSARGFEITPDLRGRVLACADSDQLGAWAERAAVASSVDEVFAAD
jgi:hypothetical protein